MSKNIAENIAFITEGCEIVGDVKVEHDLRVYGYLKGTVTVGGNLVIGQTGKIEGEITARSATIAGQIHGNIKGHEKIILETKSMLIGDLQTRELVINEGALFQGNCSMPTEDRK